MIKPVSSKCDDNLYYPMLHIKCYIICVTAMRKAHFLVTSSLCLKIRPMKQIPTKVCIVL